MGGFVVIYGLISYYVKERMYLSEPLLAVTVGIIAGPRVLNWIDPYSWVEEHTVNEITYQITRLVIAVQVLFTGIALPEKYMWKEWKSLSVLLILIMTTAWFITALLVWGIIKDLSFLEALAISSAVTPTDPVLANSITSGQYAEEHVPENVRHVILAESGANDGLGFPFMFMAVVLLARTGQDRGESVGHEIWRWFYGIFVYDILLSIAYGTVVGYIARKTLRWAAEHKLIDMSNFFGYGFGLALFTVGTAGLFGTDDILACFVVGNVFTWDDWFRLRQEETDFQEIIDMLLNVAIFMYIGMIIPWGDYNNGDIGLSGWRMVVLGITVILLRRLPWVLALYKIIPALHTWQQGFFTGWFGPIGVGAVYYIEVAIRSVPDDHTRDHLRRITSPVVLFCVFSSVLTHGVTIPITYFGPRVVRHTYRFKLFPKSHGKPGGRRNLLSRLVTWEAPPGSPNALPQGGTQHITGEHVDQHVPTLSSFVPLHGHEPFSRKRDGEEPPDMVFRLESRNRLEEHLESTPHVHDDSSAVKDADVVEYFKFNPA